MIKWHEWMTGMLSASTSKGHSLVYSLSLSIKEYSLVYLSPLPQVMYYATTEHEMINLPLTHVP